MCGASCAAKLTSVPVRDTEIGLAEKLYRPTRGQNLTISGGEPTILPGRKLLNLVSTSFLKSKSLHNKRSVFKGSGQKLWSARGVVNFT